MTSTAADLLSPLDLRLARATPDAPLTQSAADMIRRAIATRTAEIAAIRAGTCSFWTAIAYQRELDAFRAADTATGPVSLVHPSLQRTRRSDTAHGPVSLRHTDRDSAQLDALHSARWAAVDLSAAIQRNRHYATQSERPLTIATSSTDGATGAAGPDDWNWDVPTLTLLVTVLPDGYHDQPARQQQQMQQHDRRDPATLPARDQLTPAELATAGIAPELELTPEVAANLRTLAAAATLPTSPLCALLTYEETAAKLAVSVRWVRHLARTGRLTTTAGHITAPSVVAYAAQRHNTRWTKAAVPTDAQRIRHAHDAMKRAAKLECEARKLRDTAKTTLISYGPGLHDGWLISQTEPVEVKAHTRSGSWRATKAA